MTEQALSWCLTECGDWLCPVATCNQRLSRKQTLKSHLSGKHSIQGKLPSLCYLCSRENEILRVLNQKLVKKNNV